MIVGKVKCPHEVPAKEPIVQNLMVITLSALAPIEIIKLEKAKKSAFTIVPDKIKLEVVILPCMDAMRRTASVAKIAPRKEPKPIITLNPRIILKVAPKVAPAEIPKT